MQLIDLIRKIFARKRAFRGPPKGAYARPVIFLEGLARPLLVLHAVLGAGVVATSTHLFIWSRRWSRNGVTARPGTRWFAVVGLTLYALQFGLGNLMYPAYKVRVRAELLDLPSAVADDLGLRQKAREEIHARAGAPPPAPLTPLPGAALARLFDIKEHWAAIGFPLMLAACALIFRWDPRRDGAAPRLLLLCCSGGAALCAWFAAMVGVVVTAVRAV